MARTFVRQSTQIRKSDVYDDTLVPSQTAYETNAVSIEDDLNTLRSQIQNLMNRNGASFPAGNWWDDVTAPSTFEDGTERGVNELNQGLHDLERKRVLVSLANLTDVTVPSGQNFVVLGAGELPSDTTAAIGSVSTRGTVSAYAASFGAHSLAEVAGSTNIAPKNIVEIVQGNSRDPILSDNRVVYALFQVESNTDGSTMSATAGNRAQLSFVRINASGDDLEAVPAADIEGKAINYASVVRKALFDLNEQDFLRGAILDNLGSTTQNRQIAYDNQGTTPVELATNATLDLNAAGIYWELRDLLNATLLRVTEGTGTNASTVEVASDVDEFNVNAALNAFSVGAAFDTSGTQINVGRAAGTINTTGTDDLTLEGAGSLVFVDGNKAGSTYAGSFNLSANSTEWSDFETNFGEVSLINAINQAANADRRSKVYAAVTSDVAADTNVSLGDGNVDAGLGDLSFGDFLSSYDLYLNGELLRPGADAAANNDYYPGTSLANGQVKFEFPLKAGDVITLVSFSTKIA